MARTLWIAEAAVGRHHVAMRFGVDDLAFSTTYWYEGVDLDELAERFGTEALRSLLFHAVAFEANKLCSLRPQQVDFGAYRDLATEAFWELWSTVWRNVAAQWRYENALPEENGPRPAHPLAPARTGPVAAGGERTLTFVGGGKDSLVAMALLDEAGVDYDTFGYSHSVYGAAAPQHALIERLARHGRRAGAHQRQWIFDDFLDCPVAELRPDLGVRSLVAAETPSSLFGALPIALAHGYSTLALAHERSADCGNLVWGATGEEVNHQWGKSLEAERLLAGYVRTHLVADVTYTSLLKPVHDPVIFSALRSRPHALADTHSCNVRKPWCEECAKCAYVWLGYQAFADVPEGMFATNILDAPANEHWFRDLLGLSDHTPFECVGQVAESRLALHLAAARGLDGRVMETLREMAPAPSDAEVRELFEVGAEHHTMPAELAAGVLPVLGRWAAIGLAEVEGVRRADRLRHQRGGAAPHPSLAIRPGPGQGPHGRAP